MSLQLDQTSIEWAIDSLATYGDTDLFPWPIELSIIRDILADAASELAKIDLSAHTPSAPRRFIVPKDDLSYRAATQLDPLDSILLTTLIHQFASGIESRRRPVSEQSVFSYR
ncbi:MAG TPA: Retron-type reverse transcriptase, partial [Blastocatellia bacterium]|nr:Retron-type reverse transcriptase [Blastocatellia bacterium]